MHDHHADNAVIDLSDIILFLWEAKLRVIVCAAIGFLVGCIVYFTSEESQTLRVDLMTTAVPIGPTGTITNAFFAHMADSGLLLSASASGSTFYVDLKTSSKREIESALEQFDTKIFEFVTERLASMNTSARRRSDAVDQRILDIQDFISAHQAGLMRLTRTEVVTSRRSIARVVSLGILGGAALGLLYSLGLAINRWANWKERARFSGETRGKDI